MFVAVTLTGCNYNRLKVLITVLLAIVAPSNGDRFLRIVCNCFFSCRFVRSLVNSFNMRATTDKLKNSSRHH